MTQRQLVDKTMERARELGITSEYDVRFLAANSAIDGAKLHVSGISDIVISLKIALACIEIQLIKENQ